MTSSIIWFWKTEKRTTPDWIHHSRVTRKRLPEQAGPAHCPGGPARGSSVTAITCLQQCSARLPGNSFSCLRELFKGSFVCGFCSHFPFTGLSKYNTNTEAAEGSYLGCLCDLQSLLGGSLNNLEKKQTGVFRTMQCIQPPTISLIGYIYI